MALLKQPFRLGSFTWPPTAGQWKSLSDMIDDIYQRLKEGVTQVITISGDASGSGTTAITLTLPSINSNVGSYGSATKIPTVTVNAKGQVTAASETTVVAGLSSAQIMTRVYLGT